MIYILTDTDYESMTILDVLVGPDGFDPLPFEREFYHKNPKAGRPEFIAHLIDNEGFRFVDHQEIELANGYIPPSPSSNEPWAKQVRSVLDNYVAGQFESVSRTRELLKSLKECHIPIPQPRKESHMAKKPPMPKSGKAKPKGGKCK